MDNMADQAQLLRRTRLALQENNFKEAIRCLKQAAKLARDAGDVASEGRHLGNLALIYYRTQQPEKALGAFQKALLSARTDADRLTEDGILGNMGNILREIGRYDDAIAHLNQALLIAQEIGDVRGRGIWLSNLGLVYDDIQQSAKAVDFHKEAVNVARLMHDQRGLASRLANLGNSYVKSSKTSEALKCFHETVAIYKSLGDLAEAALRQGIIGNIYSDLGRTSPSNEEAIICYGLAADAYKETLGMAQELNDLPAQAELLGSLGNVYGNTGDYNQALAYFYDAQRLFSQLGMSDRLPHLQANIDLAEDYRRQQASGGQTPS
ncbi:MAG: tetratricopeptide repeat protein [Anaerolineaceae bacterium]|nr:tetratricopeptide repeat protein [Anaerolineaceae bacterium]